MRNETLLLTLALAVGGCAHDRNRGIGGSGTEQRGQPRSDEAGGSSVQPGASEPGGSGTAGETIGDPVPSGEE